MQKDNILMILWIIYGFVFIIAIETILYFIINLLYFSAFELGISFNLLTYIFPAITLILYSLTAFLLLKRVEKKKFKLETKFYEFPKKTLITLGIIILILTPLTERLSDMYSDLAIDNTDFRMGEYFLFYGWFNFGFAISNALVLVFIVLYLFNKLKV